jgi:5-methylcytosine-specific restriction endonuclease McrA
MKLPRVPQRTTSGFAFSNVARAIQEGFARRRFGKAEMEQVLAFFGSPPQCVYCGSPEVRRWDHVVPVREGGETVLGNIVPACAKCDDSKQHSPFAEWMQGDAPLSPRSRGVQDIEERIARIRAYAQEFEYTHSHIEDRLEGEEKERLETIRTTLAKTRDDLDALIADYRTRTGEV